jgi:serine/threonine-protein kinase
MRADLQLALAERPVSAEAVLTDAEKTQFIARANLPPTGPPPAEAADEYADDGSNQRRAGLIWAAVVVALLLVIGIAAYAIVRTSGGDSTSKVGVPVLIGKTPEAATSALQQAGLLAGSVTNFSGTCGDPPSVSVPQVQGNVCTQSIGAGSEQKKGTTVNFTVFVPGNVNVPNVVGLQYAAASAQVTGAKLQVAETMVDSNQPVGQVVSENPPAYTQVALNTLVTLSVSNGKTPIVSVVGQKQSDAVSALNQAGYANIKIVTQNTNDKTQDGIVLSMSPQSGSFPTSQQITLTVGKYVLPPCPTPTTTPPSGPVTGVSTSTSTSTSASNTAPPTCQ